MEERTLCFDCDGTFVDLYGVENWLTDLKCCNPRPYVEAKGLVNLSYFARLLNRAKRKGYKLIIISWLSKNSNAEYDRLVTLAKIGWLNKHLPSVVFDEINIVNYGTPKSSFGRGILFDDEARNRQDWEKNGGKAYTEKEMIEVLKKI